MLRMKLLLLSVIFFDAVGAKLKNSFGQSKLRQTRVINGVDVRPGQWPWIASLQLYETHYCGGVLISPNWVLTAAHCAKKIPDPPNFLGYPGTKLVFGSNDISRSSKSEQKIGIKRIILHPDYSTDFITATADVALLELKRPAVLNDYFNLPCMPDKGVYPSKKSLCYFAGWGMTSYPGEANSRLKHARLPVVENKWCRNIKEVVCLGYLKEAKAKKPNLCMYDSGGPLVCQRPDGSWKLDGVASFAYDYCYLSSAFAPVNKYLDWIKKYVKDL